MIQVKRKLFTITVLLILLIVSFTGCLDEPTKEIEEVVIYVDILGGKDYENIQEAIDNANEGDTIEVSPGEYFECLNIHKSIKIRGNPGTILHPRNASENKNSQIYISSDNCTIEGLTLENSNYWKNLLGIKINSSNTKISGNKITRYEYGIYLKEDVRNSHIYTGIEISDNEVSNNSNGIYLYANAEKNLIKDNDVLDNIDGINIYYHLNTTIQNNYVYSNSQYGIYLNINSDSNIVKKNVCIDNRYGIRFKGVSENEIYLNRIERNELGLYSCCGASFNKVYKNTCIDNQKHASDGFYNSWDNGVDGNYWDDYTQRFPNATKSGGHWNTPYNISDGDNLDNFPLVSPTI